MTKRITGISLEVALFLEDNGFSRNDAFCMIDEVQCEADSLGTTYAKTFGAVKLTAWGDSNRYTAVLNPLAGYETY